MDNKLRAQYSNIMEWFKTVSIRYSPIIIHGPTMEKSEPGGPGQQLGMLGGLPVTPR